MFNQKNLFGGSFKIRDKPGVCCDPCFMANEDKCVCRCHGQYHGKGRHEPDPSYEKVLDPGTAQKFKDQFDPEKTHCLCGFPLMNEPILYYVPHESGWAIPQETEKVWLYVKCPKCGYDMAIWKLGVSRGFKVQ